jgi:hypothetical protein
MVEHADTFFPSSPLMIQVKFPDQQVALYRLSPSALNKKDDTPHSILNTQVRITHPSTTEKCCLEISVVRCFPSECDVDAEIVSSLSLGVSEVSWITTRDSNRIGLLSLSSPQQYYIHPVSSLRST